MALSAEDKRILWRAMEVLDLFEKIYGSGEDKQARDLLEEILKRENSRDR